MFGKGYRYLGVWFLCILGGWSVIPYLHSSGILPFSWSAFLIMTAQTAVIFGLICWASSKIVPKTDLRPFEVRGEWIEAIGWGAGLGLLLWFLDWTVFPSSSLVKAGGALWTGLLASLYGAINEEVFLRLFLFSALYKCTSSFWVTNVVVALLFGLGHLPAAFQLTTPSFFEIFRILFLNGIAGLLFGWLYWSRGLWMAMLAHLIADLILMGLKSWS